MHSGASVSVRVTFAALRGRHAATLENVAAAISSGRFDLEDEWFDLVSGTWRPLWVLDGVPRPQFWDALQHRYRAELSERRHRVVAGELSPGAYIEWRSSQLRLVASEGVATIVGQDGLSDAHHDVDPIWRSAHVPKHVRDLYRPVRELGRGGSGRVYLAQHSHSGALCALKVTRAGLGMQAVLNELRALERVRSPHVVSVRHYEPIDDRADGRWLIVFEYVEGPTLQQYRMACPGGRVSDAGFLRDLLLGVARGLADLHRGGIVHRDLKPANIVLRGGVVSGVVPTPVIIDLGMSRGAGGMTLLGGTPGYQSPEQEVGERCTPASDVFVFGLVAYELATGRRLAGARLLKLHDMCVGLPPALDQLLKDRCAVGEVSERLPDGTRLLEALDRVFKVEGHPVVKSDSRMGSGCVGLEYGEISNLPRVGWPAPQAAPIRDPNRDDRRVVSTPRLAGSASRAKGLAAKPSSARSRVFVALFLVAAVGALAWTLLPGSGRQWTAIFTAIRGQPTSQVIAEPAPPERAGSSSVLGRGTVRRDGGARTDGGSSTDRAGLEFIRVWDASSSGVVRFVRLGDYEWTDSWEGRYAAAAYRGVLRPGVGEGSPPTVLVNDAETAAKVRAFVSRNSELHTPPAQNTGAIESSISGSDRSAIGKQFIRVRDANAPLAPRYVRVGDYVWRTSSTPESGLGTYVGLLRAGVSDGSPPIVTATEADSIAKVRAFGSD